MSKRVSSFDPRGPLDGTEIVGLAVEDGNARTTTGEIAAMIDLTGESDAALASMLQMAALPNPVGGNSVRVTELKRGGYFVFIDLDLSTEVALNPYDPVSDTGGGIYRAPDSDPTGLSGAWVRQFNGPFHFLEWNGLDTTGDAAAAADNSLGMQAAVDSSDVDTITAGGEVRLMPNVDVGEYRSQGIEYYTACLIDRDDVTIGDATLHVKGQGIVGTYIEPMFATPRDVDPSMRRGISFLFTKFDMSDDGNTFSSNQNALHLTCTDDIRMIGTVAHNTGSRRGYFSHIDNCQNIVKVGHLHSKVTGGDNYRFLYGYAWAGCLYSDFSEAVDFDGISDTIAAAAIVFRSSLIERDAQCIDMNSMINSVFSSIAVYGAGNVYTINYKSTTQDNYPDFLDGAAVTTHVPARNIVVQGVTAWHVGSETAPPINIGTDFAEEYPEGPVKRIILANHIFEDTGYITARGCEDLTLDNFILKDVLAPDSSSFGAVTLVTDVVAVGNAFPIEVTLRNIDINGCNRGALVLTSCRRGDLEGVRIRNADASLSGDPAAKITSIPAAAMFTIDRVDIAGNMTINTVDATAEIRWGLRNRLTGTLVTTGFAHQCLRGVTAQFSFNDLTATGSNQDMRIMVNRKCKVVMGYVSVGTAVPADAVNFKSCSFKSIIAGVVSTVAAINTTLGWAANTRIDGGFASNEAAVDLNAGDAFEIAWSSGGTGQAIDKASVNIEIIYL